MASLSAKQRISNEKTVYDRFASTCARPSRIARCVLLSVAFLLMLMGVAGESWAGCHAPGEDWYRDYHHGYQANSVSELLNAKPTADATQIFIYEDGEMRAIDNPLPARCQGPQCQQSPSQQSLDGLGVVELQRNVTVAISSADRELFTWPNPASDWLNSVEVSTLAGFPASLEEPPR